MKKTYSTMHVVMPHARAQASRLQAKRARAFVQYVSALCVQYVSLAFLREASIPVGRARAPWRGKRKAAGARLAATTPPATHPAARRKLKRRLSRGPLPIEVKDVTCIKGGSCRIWQVVPVAEYLGERCVAIVSSDPWLQTLLMGQMHKSVYTGAIINFVDDCRLAMQRMGAAASGAPATSHAAAGTNHAAAKSNAAKPAGRKAVFGSEDESSGPDQEATTRSPDEVKPRLEAKKEDGSAEMKKRFGYKPSCKGFDTISVRDITIKCARGRTGRRILVPLAGGHVDKIVQHLCTRAGEPRRQGPVQSMKMLLSEMDAHVIQWRAHGGTANQEHGHWEIRYQDAGGATRISRAGLGVKVDNQDAANSQDAAHGDDDYIVKRARAALRIARRTWNFRDESGAPRLVNPHDDMV